MLKREYSPAT